MTDSGMTPIVRNTTRLVGGRQAPAALRASRMAAES